MPEKTKTYEKSARKVYIRTFGCQMNDRDSELVMGMLFEKGFLKAESPKEADVIIFNTCSVRKHAEDRLFNAIYRLRESKATNPRLVIGAIGCTAQIYKERLLAKFPHADFICGPSNIYEISEIVNNILRGRSEECKAEKTAAVDLDKRPLLDIDSSYRQNPATAYVNVSYGCDNFCSYCIVPYARGREISRPKDMILKEIGFLAERGCREIALLGQNVNSYRDTGAGGKFGFVNLLKEVNEIDGIKRIRFMTSHPKDAGFKLFEAIRDLDKVDRHLHLPLQSGSDRILKLMNRGYIFKNYRNKVKLLRALVPDIKLSTDIIVGFPEEKEEDFDKTRKAMEDIKFDKVFVFKYSPRPPAAASRMKDDVPEEIKKRRNNILLDLQNEIFKINKGKPVHVP